jgi:flagellar hook-associated protein 1 FlgK
MASSFGGINTALSSLYAQRRALDVTGQNIANVNTAGYTRQRVEMQSQVGSISPAMYAKTDGLGTGVGISSVQRLRDDYAENRGRSAHADSAYLTNQTSAYTEIEDAFAEPSDTALQSQLHDMWGGWNDVANNPQIDATRSTLIQQSSTVADGLNSAHDALAGQFAQNHTQLDAYANEVNTAATTIAQLNDHIVKATGSGVTVNELLDQRDAAVMHLSELTGATASMRPNGAMDVFVGNSNLVSEFTTRSIEVVGAARLDDQSDIPVNLRWADTQTATGAGGTMGAMVDTMTTILPTQSRALDEVARSLASLVNTEHKNGFDVNGDPGKDFFVARFDDPRQPPPGTITAANIMVGIVKPDEVAVSSTDRKVVTLPATVGAFDGKVADKIADLGEKADGPDGLYRTMIGNLGVDSQATSRRNDIQTTVTEQADSDREAESGVNLDEEMTNLLTYQRGYEAASRVLTTIDSMLDQLINRTGLVGR